MTPRLLADASALQVMPTLIDVSKLHTHLLAELTKRVEEQTLCFPREVADDLMVTARGDVIAGWASGLGSKLRQFKADIAYARPLMGYVKQCGFDAGFELLNGQEPSLASLGRLACQYAAEEVSFVVVTEDSGESPLSPTTEQLCQTASWGFMDARAAIRQIGLGEILV
jgi:hypothetical protein